MNCSASPVRNRLLADCYGAASRPRDGLDAIANALSAVLDRGHFFYASELYRLKGILLLATLGAESDEAEEALSQAPEVAREQKSSAMELRAAAALARLFHSRKKPLDAVGLLQDAMSQFDAKLDTPDLRDARVLMQTL